MQAATQTHSKSPLPTREGDVLARIASEPPRSLQITNSLGSTIEALVYEPEGSIHGNVLIHSATACPQRFYASFARHLTHAGLRVFTYDYRGIGKSRSRSLRGATVTIAEWALVDARAMHDYLAAHHLGVPLALVGHSFGAQLFGLLDEPRSAYAALFVGAQLGYCGFWPEPRASLLKALWRFVVPGMCRVFGYLPKQTGIGQDLPSGVALQWARWCSHPEYLMSEFPDARERYERFDRPILAYNFSDDTYAPRRSIDALFKVMSSAPVTQRNLSPADLGVASVGHFGFFRPSSGAKLWDEAAEFLLSAVRELPRTAA